MERYNLEMTHSKKKGGCESPRMEVTPFKASMLFPTSFTGGAGFDLKALSHPSEHIVNI